MNWRSIDASDTHPFVIVHRSNYRGSLIKSLSFRSSSGINEAAGRRCRPSFRKHRGWETQTRQTPHDKLSLEVVERFQGSRAWDFDGNVFLPDYFSPRYKTPPLAKISIGEWRQRHNWITRLIELRDVMGLERRFVSWHNVATNRIFRVTRINQKFGKPLRLKSDWPWELV